MTESIGFIGLGVLGSAVAQNFVEGGQPVYGFDLSADAKARAAATGVEIASFSDQVGERCDTVFTCLPDAEALREVMSGADGLLARECPNQMIVELSTLSLNDKLKFAKACHVAGRRPVDCPVSGNRIMALKRGLTAFCSGEKADFDQLKPILELTCRKSHYVGAFGQGTKIKICGNILNLVHNSVAAEAMVLAMKSGLDPKLFYEVIAGSGSSSAMFESRGELMVDRNYEKEGMNFSIPIKDARIISGHAADLDCPLPIYQSALQFYYSAVARGLGDKDAAAVCEVMAENAGLDRKANGPENQT